MPSGQNTLKALEAGTHTLAVPEQKRVGAVLLDAGYALSAECGHEQLHRLRKARALLPRWCARRYRKVRATFAAVLVAAPADYALR